MECKCLHICISSSFVKILHYLTTMKKEPTIDVDSSFLYEAYLGDNGFTEMAGVVVVIIQPSN